MMSNDPTWAADCANLAIILLMFGAAGAIYLFGCFLFKGWNTARVITRDDKE